MYLFLAICGKCREKHKDNIQTNAVWLHQGDKLDHAFKVPLTGKVRQRYIFIYTNYM